MNLPASTALLSENYTQRFNINNNLIKINAENDIKLRDEHLLLFDVCFCDHLILNKYLMKWLFKKGKRKLKRHNVHTEKTSKVVVQNKTSSSECEKRNINNVVIKDLFVRTHSFNESEIETLSLSTPSNLTASQTHTEEYENSRNVLNLNYPTLLKPKHSYHENDTFYKRRNTLLKYIHGRAIFFHSNINLKNAVFRMLPVKTKFKQCYVESKINPQEVLSMDFFPVPKITKEDGKTNNDHLQKEDKLKGKQFSSLQCRNVADNDIKDNINTKQKQFNLWIKSLSPRIQCKIMNSSLSSLSLDNTIEIADPKIINKLCFKKWGKSICQNFASYKRKEKDMILALVKNRSKQQLNLSGVQNCFGAKTVSGSNTQSFASVYNAESVLGFTKILPTVKEEYEFYDSMDTITNINILSKAGLPKINNNFTRVKSSNNKTDGLTQVKHSQAHKYIFLKTLINIKPKLYFNKKSVKIGADKVTEGFPIDHKKSLEEASKNNERKQKIRKQLVQLMNKVFAVQLCDIHADQTESIISLPLRFKYPSGDKINASTQGASILSKNVRINSYYDLIAKSSNSLVVNVFGPPAPQPSVASFRSSQFCSKMEYGYLNHLIYRMKNNTKRSRMRLADEKDMDEETNLFDEGFGPMFARANRKNPELDMINWNYERILGIVPNRYKENNEAALLGNVFNTAKGKTYQGPYHGIDLTSEALELTWGKVPKGKVCACPYDYCNCKGYRQNMEITPPSSYYGKRGVCGGLWKCLNLFGCAGCGFRRDKSNSTFPQKLIETVEKEKNICKDALREPAEICLTGCHAY
ncbi:unnamed protein product [Plutella xylostella]|uniref:(diamondback moth) hypothetical protein n=1 Tax=Plutella xylostella TaxID=51655 RepID=A0A8S4F1K9_PLUXY|nr:unnamed protein product [Plutella xylostella]